MLTNVIATLLMVGAPIKNPVVLNSNLSSKETQACIYTVYNDAVKANSGSDTNSFSSDCINYISGDTMEKALILKNSIEHNGNVVKLKKGVSIPIRKTAEGYEAENKELEIYCVGANLNELIEEIKEDLFVSVELYVKCDVNELTKDAVEFRTLLQEYVE